MSARNPMARPMSLLAADDADYPGAAKTGHDLVAAESLEFSATEPAVRCTSYIQLRLHMQVAAPSSDIRVQVGDAIDYRHRELRRYAVYRNSLANIRSCAS